jgi:hypothetical protein
MGTTKQGGKSKKTRQHVKNEGKYKVQAQRTAKNKERAWAKHIDRFPNDKKAIEEIKKARKF